MKNTVIFYFLLCFCSPTYAINWTFLDGTEPDGSTEQPQFLGYLQPDAQYLKGTKLDAGPYVGSRAIFNQVGPKLKDNDELRIRRGGFSVRGLIPSTENKVNYYFVADIGRNGVTEFENEFILPTDWSITFNTIPYARVRIGQYKYPGSEEGQQAISLINHNNPSNVSNLMMVERHFDETGYDTTHPNNPNGSIGAFRDIGIQIFDRFSVRNWEHTYAVMFGQGHGLNRRDDNGNIDYRLYWSSEDIFSGTRAKRQGMKLYGWYSDGTRSIDSGLGRKEEFSRRRYGVGMAYRNKPWRFYTEYMDGKGMLLTGTDGGALPGASDSNGNIASFNISVDGEANGWYIDTGYHVFNNFEISLRYDRYNLSTESSSNQRLFNSITLSGKYHIKKNIWILGSFESRHVEAPHLDSNSLANQILNDVDNRVSVSMLWVFPLFD